MISLVGRIGITALGPGGVLVTTRTALILAATAVAGTPIGVFANSTVSAEAFGTLLGVFVAIIAVLVRS